MIVTVAGVTFRALVSRRRAILMFLLVLIPVALATLARFRGLPGDPVDRTVGAISQLIIRTILPLVALVFGTSAIGAELEDGTAIHLLTKPVDRWRIVAGKILAAAPVTIGLILTSVLLTGLVLGGGRGGESVTVALAIAAAIGCLMYVTVFVALSVVTSRALIFGLVYVVIWEGVLSGLFEGSRALSIREYTMAIARAIDPSGGISETLAPLDLPTAIAGTIIVLVAGFWIASWRLASMELTGGD